MIELTKLRVVPVPPISGVLMEAGSLAMVSSTARSSLQPIVDIQWISVIYIESLRGFGKTPIAEDRGTFTWQQASELFRHHATETCMLPLMQKQGWSSQKGRCGDLQQHLETAQIE